MCVLFLFMCTQHFNLAGDSEGCWILGLYNSSNFTSWPIKSTPRILLACFIENKNIVGDSNDQIINKTPCILCYPLFDDALFQDGHICFYESRAGDREGPFLRSMGDLQFLYQIPAKYTSKLSKGKHIKHLFHTQNNNEMRILYGFLLKQNQLLRRFSSKCYKKLQHKVYKYINIIYIPHFFLLFLYFFFFCFVFVLVFFCSLVFGVLLFLLCFVNS